MRIAFEILARGHMPAHNLQPAILVLTSALMVTAMPTMSHADLRVGFFEGAPKDRFRIENTSTCTIADSSITLDLSPLRQD